MSVLAQRLWISGLIFIFFNLKISSQPVNFFSSNLPIVILETNGAPIPDEPKITGKLRIINKGPGNINYVNDVPNVYDDQMGIELRGSSSLAVYPKKGYSIELRDSDGEEQEVSLLGMPEDDDWILAQPLNDKTLMRDWLAYRLGRESMEWAPRTRHVEVVLNGQYEGVYVLMERIKRDKNRVNIGKMTSADITGQALTGGYILAFDKVQGGFGGDWKLPYPPLPGSWQETWAQVVYPKAEDIAPQQRAYIEHEINALDSLMYNWTPNQPGAPPYEGKIDVDSWVNYLLVNELTKNVDAYRLSAYFYKDRDSTGGLIHMGPVWDYNIALGIGDYCSGQDFTGWAKDFNQYCGQDTWVIHYWWDKMCRDYTFQQRVRQRWQEMRQFTWNNSQLVQTIDSLGQQLQGAQQRNFQRWPVLGQYIWPNAFVGSTWQEELSYLKIWLISRANWMDANINGIGPVPVRDVVGQDGPVSWFPNPVSSGTLHLEYFTDAPLDLRIFDLAGRLAGEFTGLPSGRPMHVKLDVGAQLRPGCYVAQFSIKGLVVQSGKLFIDQ
ncbi:MAG: CotH kinase family protein [Saprospiraceae bacterium]|nr:CotH kinase family protein [Saprospiraceae bacterium]